MSSEQPSSGRPTGPPSGPLSGPSQPSPVPAGPTRASGQVPPEPPSDASGPGGAGGPGGTGGSGGPGGGSGGSGDSRQGPGGPGHPWWRSAPRIALMLTAAVVAVVLIVVFTRSDDSGGSAGGEVFLQAAGKSGPDPFTESTATDSSTPPETPTATPSSEPANVTRAVDGSSPGLYGGTRNVSSCDVEKQIKVLRANPAKNDAFASVAGVKSSDVPAHLRSLTPVQLRMDTRVTNHGYRDGAATSYQAVLQSGTAVLVDDRGVPRVRCACGNPLKPPVALKTTPEPKGDSWPSYRPQNVVVIERSTVIINVFVLYDPEHDDWFTRHSGDTGGKDKKTTPPVNQPSPSASTSFSEEPPSKSPEPCPSSTDRDAHDSASPCPSSSSVAPSTSPPSRPEAPTSEPTKAPENPETADSPPDDTTTTESASLYDTPESITPGS
ncbi:DUF6777 domain-containing protein [Streptomyces sp. NBC_01314]|uniref:DUF6777 domain-containing protein n=1 Tax=Streptomyces sp. NBC_01314 TaxID=2903821 RepID=UPI003092DB4F|nr:hypothetical protein OG622_47510 [Streptomyces sp. NBC_01314]